MGVYHRCANVFVPKKFLDGMNIIAGLKQMRGKRVTNGVATGVLSSARIIYNVRLFHIITKVKKNANIFPVFLGEKNGPNHSRPACNPRVVVP